MKEKETPLKLKGVHAANSLSRSLKKTFRAAEGEKKTK